MTRVGRSWPRDAHRKLPYKFHYIPDPIFINAFALPGGHVYVGAGLLELMDSEDELAAVLGHEIEHIDHYHCAERVQREQALRKIPLGGLVALPVEVFEAGYSKDQELEADREGTRLAVEAGYSAEWSHPHVRNLRAVVRGVPSQGEDAARGTVAGGAADAGRIFPLASATIGAHCPGAENDRE